MTERSSKSVVRKLALPLEILMGDDTVVTDGVFSLASNQTSKIQIKSIDTDGYAICEIALPSKIQPQTIRITFEGEPELIDTELSKSRGSGEDYGQYKYYKRSDGFYYAIIVGKNRLDKKINLGKLTNKNSRIAIFARMVIRLLNGKEFTKKDIGDQIKYGMPKRLIHGQILKSMLGILVREGYLQKREAPEHEQGKSREYYKTTTKMLNIVGMVSPEQSYNA